MKKIACILFLVVGACTMLVMSFHYFQSDTTGILKRKEVADSFWYLCTFRTHILLGLIAISIGPFQFLKRIRMNYKKVHKTIGYVYSISVVFSAISGFVIAQFSMGGSITSIGFSILSMVWLYTTIQAIISIRLGDVVNHKKWMFLSYALTFSSITQRILLLIPLLTDTPFMPIYQLSAWLPWVLNVAFAYSLFKRSQVQGEKIGSGDSNISS